MHECVSVTLTQGRRQYMEDTYVVKDFVQKSYSHSKTKTTEMGKLIAIFDGHGGDAVSNMCRDNMHEILKRHVISYPDMGIALRRTFKELDDKSKSIGQRCGSTAAVVVVLEEIIWSANCGDSETMVGFKDGRFEMLSQCHKVEDELPRLRELGASITYDDGCARLFRMLNLARSIGDYHLKRYVISTPFVNSIKITSNVEYILIGSDGLWDVWDRQEIHSEVKSLKRQMLGKGMNFKQMTDAVNLEIVKKSLIKGSGDNITTIVYFF